MEVTLDDDWMVRGLLALRRTCADFSITGSKRGDVLVSWNSLERKERAATSCIIGSTRTNLSTYWVEEE